MSLKGLFPQAENFTGVNAENSIRGVASSKSNNPWEDLPGDDLFFPTPKITADNWNRVFPYRLVVVDANKEGNLIVAGTGSDRSEATIETSYFTSGSGFILSQKPIDTKWIFELPLTPQQIQIVDQYAINTVATARGVLEEHNGVKFKTISINATTGIFPARTTTGSGISVPTVLGSESLGTVFAGSLEAAQNLGQSVGRVKSAFDGSRLGSSQNSGTVDTSLTGYYQALLLSNFLERYAQEKKNPANKGWRLVLDIPKMNVSYVVTPMSFALQKSVQSPNEFNISMQLKAWKRIKINQTAEPVAQVNFKITPNTFQRILNTIRETRRVLSNSINLLRAVRSDFQKPLEALRQTALAVKDLSGVVITAADLPGQIINDYKSSFQTSLEIASSAFKRSNSQTQSKLESQEAKSAFIAAAFTKERGLNEGLSLEQVNNGAIGLEVVEAVKLRNSNRLYERPEEFFDILDSVDIQSVNLSPDQTDRIADEISAASLINIDDLKSFRNDLLETALLISNNYGSGDETYSRIYNRPAPKQRATPLTIEETEVATALFEAIREYDTLTASRFFDDLKIQNPMEYVGGLADDAGIDFSTSSGKKLVPVPFNLTIEQIAARYLGDANRWLEIVTLNKLRMPYIDETGFTYELLSNASGRQINVNDQDQRLYVGQGVVLFSTTTPPFKRKVISVERISDTNYLVTLDGEDNLDILTTNSQAKVRGYLPGTVNSQNQIFIPIDGAVESDDLVTLPKVFQEDKLSKISKIDWLLDDNGDLAINEVGEIQLAGGLTNLIQALKLKIRTKKGSILQHPNYGLGITHGISIADIESGELVKELTKMINDDPRYNGINRLDIRVKGSSLFIDLAVNLASGTGVLPITFEV